MSKMDVLRQALWREEKRIQDEMDIEKKNIPYEQMVEKMGVITKIIELTKDIDRDMPDETNVSVVETNDWEQFEKECNALYEKGYVMSSSGCGYIPDPYDCNYYTAILIRGCKES